MGCHFLLQEIFPTQGSNLGLLYCRQTLYHLSHQGSQRKLQGISDDKYQELSRVPGTWGHVPCPSPLDHVAIITEKATPAQGAAHPAISD